MRLFIVNLKRKKTTIAKECGVISLYINDLELELNKRKAEEQSEILKKKAKKKKKKNLQLEQQEQRLFNLEMEKQRQAQEHELKRIDKLLQIEEMKLIREREQRQAEQDQIDSLKDSIRQS